MGQQQLILLVLATVIVGIAIVVGIRAFTENSAKANSDAMIQDAVRMASDMQVWKKKPAPFGGQASLDACDADCVADGADYTGVEWALLGYGPTTDDVYTNLNGSFEIDETDPAGATITGTNTTERNQVVVTVTGITDGGINGAIACLGGVTPDGTECLPVDGGGE